MRIRILRTPEDFRRYRQWLHVHPDATLWQSLEWKTYMEALKHDVHTYVLEEGSAIKASALVVIDRTVFGFSTWEIPRGPIGEYPAKLLERIIEDAKKSFCLALYYSPPHPPTTSHSSFSIHLSDRKASKRHVHCEATRIIDLTLSEENILTQMHQKGRYNIRVAQKHGITVTPSNDIDAFYALLKETGSRDTFTIHPQSHYKAFLKHLKGSFLLLAFRNPSPLVGEEYSSPTRGVIAGLLGVIWGTQGIYYYGASSYAYRALMAPYMVQWDALRHCKVQGCKTYDLLGITPPPSVGQERSCPTEGGVLSKLHPWMGISAFKEKFGGKIVTYPPEQQIILRPFIARMLRWKRKIFG